MARGDAVGTTVEFFAAPIRNPHTRKAYARAAGGFAAWRFTLLTIFLPDLSSARRHASVFEGSTTHAASFPKNTIAVGPYRP